MDVKRKLSPISEAMKYSIGVVGLQQRKTPKSQQRTVKASSVRFDEGKNWMVGKKPCARDGQIAVVYQDYMLIFGGDRHMMSFHDVYYFRMDEALRVMNDT